MRGIVAIAGCLLGCTLVANSDVAPEQCDNGMDDDYDGRRDCADSDCLGVVGCPSGEVDEPRFAGTCIGSWRSSRTGNHCEPWAADDWTRCRDGYRLPGDTECVPVGDGRCREPALPLEVYLDTEAAPGGVGTREAPFATIEEALAAVTDGGTLVFRGSISLPPINRPINISGVCPQESTVIGTVQLDTPEGTEVPLQWLENLSIRALPVDRGGDGVALRVARAVDLSLDLVDLSGEVEIVGGQVRVRRSKLTGALAVAPADAGFGLPPFQGSLKVEGSTISPPLTGGDAPCVTVETSVVEFQDVVFEECPDGAVIAGEATTVTVDHSVFAQVAGVGIDFQGTTVSIADSIARRTGANAEPLLRVRSGSAIVFGSVLEGGAGPAVVLDPLDAAGLSMADVSIVDAGVRVDGGGLQLIRAELRHGAGYAIDIRGGSIEASHVAVIGGDGSEGGLRASDGTSIELDDFVFETVGECAFDVESGVMLVVSNGSVVEARAGFCVPEGAYPDAELNRQIAYVATDDTVRTTR